MTINIEEIYRKMRPWLYQYPEALVQYPKGITLGEMRIHPLNTEFEPHMVDLSSTVGDVTFNFPMLAAAMDTVSGPNMGRVMHEIGGAAIIWKQKKKEKQLEMLEEVLRSKPCLVREPEALEPSATLADAKEILDEYDFSTIPICTRGGLLKGILFTRNVSFHDPELLDQKVSKWMTPISDLKTMDPRASFDQIKQKLQEPDCSVVPIVANGGKFRGIYFMKDFKPANPSWHRDKPLVGMAIGVRKNDLDLVEEGLELGVGIIVIDSSHGNCTPVIRQAERVVKLVAGRALVIAGNVADIDGYYRLAMVGVDGVKAGIGSGSICTTSIGTGAGYPMFTLIRELQYIRDKMLVAGLPAPIIIPDGDISGPGPANVALAAGGHLGMAGEWFVSAKESYSFVNGDVVKRFDEEMKRLIITHVYYRGMASKAAIRSRSLRHGYQKTAEEGIEGYVSYRGPMKTWIHGDMDLMRGGWAHLGAGNLADLHRLARSPEAFIQYSSAGMRQNEPRIAQRI